MAMTARQNANGVRSARHPDRWLVPPWPTGASLCTVVRHFLSHRPRHDATDADQLAYYTAYLAAIEAAPKQELTHPCHRRWYDELRDCLLRCVAVFRQRAQVIQR
jgi:hypothetical protein